MHLNVHLFQTEALRAWGYLRNYKGACQEARWLLAVLHRVFWVILDIPDKLVSADMSTEHSQLSPISRKAVTIPAGRSPLISLDEMPLQFLQA